MARLNAEIDEERRRRLYHVLLDERISFAEWLRRQIDAYLSEKERKETPGSKSRYGVEYGAKWPLRTREGVKVRKRKPGKRA